MYSNICYFQEVWEQNLEGNVVVIFVVEKDGSFFNLFVLKDIGGGVGLEVFWVVEVMNEVEICWVFVEKDGELVWFQYIMFIKFKLEEVLFYMMVGRDLVYIIYDMVFDFIGGQEVLWAYLEENLEYFEVLEDICIVGWVELQLLVWLFGEVCIFDLVDYNDLGFDFWYEVIDVVIFIYGKWDIVIYEGWGVLVVFDLSLFFIFENIVCVILVEEYEVVNILVQEGVKLFVDEEQELGFVKLMQAIDMFLNNVEFLFMWGQVYLDMQCYSEVCFDLCLVWFIFFVIWYDVVLLIICWQ